MLSCEWVCRFCKVDMTSLADGITWCPNCGRVTSVFAPQMMPEMSKMIFEAKKSVGQDVPESLMKVHWGHQDEQRPKLEVIR